VGARLSAPEPLAAVHFELSQDYSTSGISDSRPSPVGVESLRQKTSALPLVAADGLNWV
jgi:hypothetical protein